MRRMYKCRWPSALLLGLSAWLIFDPPAAGELRAELPWITVSNVSTADLAAVNGEGAKPATSTSDVTPQAAGTGLSPRGGDDAARSAHALPPQGTASDPGVSAGKSLTTVFAGLAMVVGLFLALAWVFRRAAPTGSGALPPEAFEVLGRGRLSSKQVVSLVRCGGKLLLVSQAADGPRTLTEIEQPDEVSRLAVLCKQNATRTSTSTFRDVFQQLGGVRRETTAGRGRHEA